jgi:hypothetical protein
VKFPQLRYAVEKYHEVVCSLATGESHIRHRLLPASFNLMLIGDSMVPDELNVRQDIAWIQSQLTRFGDVSLTLRKIRGKTAVKIAERVVSVWRKLEGLEHRNDT